MFRPAKKVAPDTTGPDTIQTTQATAVAGGRPGILGYVLAALRFALGWTFLWAFLDKTFGLGYATPAENAWIDGGTPTAGFLGNVDGPFEGFFTGMAGQAWADWLFMIGLLGIGLALILGIGMRIAAVTGSALLILMYMAALPLTNNPFMDTYIIEILLVVALALAGAGRVLGLGKVWARLPIVKKNPWLV
ncbi:DoxX family membrane protein [Phytoactinopolyspora limicola]|uniref:DoxX family membrane protein n=1 Tax=Phytoactinopolyspora limicola TaxID=2715536 RepID=UPI0014095EF2|nr:DoxX family membrane protein [Phytoactinopolyspora limicola]